jgi:hypothetical protein
VTSVQLSAGPQQHLQQPALPRRRLSRLLSLLLLSGAALAAGDSAAQTISGGSDEYALLLFDITLPPAAEAAPEGAEATAGSHGSAAAAGAAASAANSTTETAADSSAGIAEPRSAEDRSRALASLQDSINGLMTSDGLYSPQLRERYQQLGALQEELGQHESAVSTLEQAMHIARVNDGLFTIEQIPDIERIIANLEALSDAERAADYRAYLYHIQQRAFAPGDPRLTAARIAWADWNLREYQRSALLDPRSLRLPGAEQADELIAVRDSRTGEVRFVPRRGLLGGPLMNSSLADPSRPSLTPEMVEDLRLREARNIYEELLDSDDPALGPEQREQLRLQLVSAEYSQKYHLERLAGAYDRNTPFLQSSGFRNTAPTMLRRGFNSSSELLTQEIAALEAASPPDAAALATAYLRQADLHVAYNRRREADPWYSKAWDQLRQSLSDADARARLEQPPLQPVPDYAIHPYSRALFGIGPDDTVLWRGYIDVSLSLTRDGDVRSTRIVAASDDTPQRVRRLLLDWLRNQKMRPRLQDGVPTTSDGLLVRFNYRY